MSDEQMLAEIDHVLRRNQGTGFLRHVLTVLLAAEKAWGNRETGRADA